MKKLIYLFLFTILGVLLGFLTATFLTFAAATLLTKSYDRFGFGLVFWQWQQLFYFLFVSLMALGAVIGLWQGFLWWKILYIEGRRFGKKNKAIAIDFDHTVFNTALYVQALRKKFKKVFNIDEQIFLDNYNQLKQCCAVTDINELVRLLPHQNKKALQDAHYQLLEENGNKFIFPDAQEFINHHRKNFDIIFLTHGRDEIYHDKIKNTKLPQNLEVIISSGSNLLKLEELSQQYQQLHFIDDKKEPIEAAKQSFREINTYLLKRTLSLSQIEQDVDFNHVDHVVSGLNFEIDS